MSLRPLYAALGLLLATGLSASGGQIRPPEPGLGEPAELELEAAPADSTEIPVGMGVWIQPTADPTRFQIKPLRVGEVGVILAGADTLRWVVPSTISQPRAESLRPVRSVGEIRPNWWPTLAVLAVLLAPLLWWLRRFVHRRSRGRIAFPIPPEPAHRLALRRLEAIATSSMLSDGAYERYYVEGSHTLREYLQGRYRVPALDWTSAELLERMRESGYRAEELSAIKPLLVAADSVKFAAGRPSDHSATQWLEGIRDFVQATAVELRFSTPEALAAAEKMTGGRAR